MYGKCDIKFDLIQRRSILTSSAHNRTSANRLWQMVGGADQRLHVGLPGPTGVGGTRVQHIFAQSRFFLSDSSEEICLYMTTQRLLVRFYFFFGETQNKRADSGGWWEFFGCCSAGAIRAGLNNSAPPAAPLPSYTDLVYIRSFQVGAQGASTSPYHRLSSHGASRLRDKLPTAPEIKVEWNH